MFALDTALCEGRSSLPECASEARASKPGKVVMKGSVYYHAPGVDLLCLVSLRLAFVEEVALRGAADSVWEFASSLG